MLVKIVPKGKQTHCVFECNNYHVIHRPSENGSEPYEELVLNLGTDQTVQNLGSGDKVYIMNNDGKTIDTYWF